MAHETASPKLQAVAAWLDTLAISPTEPLYERVLESCQDSTHMLGRTATNAITQLVAATPSNFIALHADENGGLRERIKERIVETDQACVFEHDTLPSDNALVKIVGEKAATFRRYTIADGIKSSSWIYIPDDADASYRPIEGMKGAGHYSVIYLGQTAVQTLQRWPLKRKV